jgi:thioredoxin 1
VKHVLYFTAEWCNPCKKVRPIVDEINREYSDSKFIVVDVDSEIELASNFGVKSIPTFILIKDGEEVSRLTGAKTKEQLEEFINNE